MHRSRSVAKGGRSDTLDTPIEIVLAMMEASSGYAALFDA
jgi:hypothetical protein